MAFDVMKEQFATIDSMTTSKITSWIRQVGWPSLGPILVILLLVGGAATFGIYKGAQWRAFKTAHNCQKVEHVSGDVLPIFGVNPSNGQPSFGVAIEPDKVGWRCDDGVTYWR
ncbi:hypothetical protein VAPA_1c13640 [Variovorax paradoxus B4]|uniref:Transmembrane protein n=1 Tax=Variovorax paradoxus B4 TaxID=1246301 RepID=T1X816_VARPD|nr:hypothetical protein [Variovorax paradoxus]AGU48479.1 hypothetical protein VAPA_1c13640 [Variovorax paradoxus B4]